MLYTTNRYYARYFTNIFHLDTHNNIKGRYLYSILWVKKAPETQGCSVICSRSHNRKMEFERMFH